MRTAHPVRDLMLFFANKRINKKVYAIQSQVNYNDPAGV